MFFQIFDDQVFRRRKWKEKSGLIVRKGRKFTVEFTMNDYFRKK